MPCFRIMDDLGRVVPGAEEHVPELEHDFALAIMATMVRVSGSGDTCAIQDAEFGEEERGDDEEEDVEMTEADFEEALAASRLPRAEEEAIREARQERLRRWAEPG